MKKAAMGMLALLLLTGCWDRMPIRDLHMVDIVGLDREEKSGNFVVDIVNTILSKTGQGQGEPISETSELKGPSILEAVGKGEYIDEGRFVGISTRIYLMSERFASHEPFHDLAFVLQAPYTSINSPVVVYEGDMTKLLKTQSGTRKPLTKKMNDFIKALERNEIMFNVSLMYLILSYLDPLEDVALPLLKQYDSGMELEGALLFRDGTSTGVKLDQEQVRMMMIMKGRTNARQRISGHLPGSSVGKQPNSDPAEDVDFGFSAKKALTKITVQPGSNGLPNVSVGVQLKINTFEIGEGLHLLKPDYVNQMEKELNKYFEKKAADTIEMLQKANCDVLGIGKQIKAFHPSLWKSLNWRTDYPRMSIKPKFDVQILNADPE
ncbi:Ger(x)C family spore germination C-terminal domain-containing protein [Paenibacillus cremeus]|uniref:Spore gernimation protein GerC n=1 Tax=Paenibacillus cremeus TaxID=2163881 RepID=A0A559K9S6_9BACL|nr:Ger(x)C family spore germination C-terminal domain-containing protein [Paenibacillus cremeus]TVY08869.1 spore gernimation protein GerC [Paenibacillus cremeus]